jgi:hypothetical protein
VTPLKPSPNLVFYKAFGGSAMPIGFTICQDSCCCCDNQIDGARKTCMLRGLVFKYETIADSLVETG